MTILAKTLCMHVFNQVGGEKREHKVSLKRIYLQHAELDDSEAYPSAPDLFRSLAWFDPEVHCFASEVQFTSECTFARTST